MYVNGTLEHLESIAQTLVWRLRTCVHMYRKAHKTRNKGLLWQLLLNLITSHSIWRDLCLMSASNVRAHLCVRYSICTIWTRADLSLVCCCEPAIAGMVILCVYSAQVFIFTIILPSLYPLTHFCLPRCLSSADCYPL